MITRRTLLAGIAVSGGVAPASVFAHHGWRWTADGAFELSGIISEANLGMPHGVLTVDVEGEMWTVEVGQPWRNERAGLTDDLLSPGTEIIALGHRSADEGKNLMKAERIEISGTVYDLYPNRS